MHGQPGRKFLRGVQQVIKLEKLKSLAIIDTTKSHFQFLEPTCSST